MLESLRYIIKGEECTYCACPWVVLGTTHQNEGIVLSMAFLSVLWKLFAVQLLIHTFRAQINEITLGFFCFNISLV